MENYTYNSYPESGGSSPRSREIDFENPSPWEDQNNNNNNNNTNTYKVKLMCSYGGKIHPRPHDNQLAYVGGETKILAVDRLIKFPVLVSKLAAICDADICFKYQLPGEDLDALISVTNDDDLDHMMNEYDRLNRASPKPARLRLFLFCNTVPTMSPTNSFGSVEGRSERERFVDALNSGPVGPVQSSNSPSTGNADFLFGSEKILAPMPVGVPVVKGGNINNVNNINNIPEVAVLDDRAIGVDRIQKHIEDLRRLRISEDRQEQQHRQNLYEENLASGYYVQRQQTEKVVSPASPVPGYQVSGGGYAASSNMLPDQQQQQQQQQQQPVYMIPAQSGMYHAPMARPVTGPVGHNQGQGQGQGYYAVQRMPSEVYRDQQPVYNAMQPVQSMTQQHVFPPPSPQHHLQQQQQPMQKIATNNEGVRMVQSTVGMVADAGYGQVAYDNSLGRHVYYTAQGAMVTPQQQQVPLHLQQTTHQYQPVAATSATLSQDGKVIAPPKITQGSI